LLPRSWLWLWLAALPGTLACAPRGTAPAAPPGRAATRAAPADHASAPPVLARAELEAATSPDPAEAVVSPSTPGAEVPFTFDQGPWRLQGTLTWPARREGGPVPAAVIVPGSGPMSRDGIMRGQLGLGFGFDLPVYERLAAALAARGYAVLRYDKRTCGPFNGCAENRYPTVPYALRASEFSTFQYLQDAVAAVGALSQHPGIDDRRVFVVGHSQGGSLVPLLLQVLPSVPAGVMLAPPFHSLDALVDRQSARVFWAFTQAGLPQQAERERAELAAVATELRRLEAGTQLGDPILGEPPAVWASWVRLNLLAPTIARDLERPLLVLGGDYDYNVEPSEIEAWKTWLRGARRVPHEVRVLPCVTHALNCISQPDPTRIQPQDIGHDAAPSLVDAVARFLDRAGPRSPGVRTEPSPPAGAPAQTPG
jgi:alpha-beta hydrolase superfamily lysophospholipase